jgi:hypothetical protein
VLGAALFPGARRWKEAVLVADVGWALAGLTVVGIVFIGA